MTTQTAVYQEESRVNFRKFVWRTDAIVTALAGDLMLFTPGLVTELLGMSDNASRGVQAVGVWFIVYGLFGLWAARTGTISRFAYYVGVDMMVSYVAFTAAILLLGVQFNTLGYVAAIGVALVCVDLGWLWWTGARQSS